MRNWRDFLLLGLLGLMTSGLIALVQKSPGYMDADYYYAGGLQLAAGKGFSEPYLWNYLDDPIGLPHPSNAYWMPLASIIAAVGMILTGQLTWVAARIGFLIIAVFIPLVTYKLSYSLSGKRNLALFSGFCSIFSGFYFVFLPVTDTFGIYLLLGGLFFLTAYKKNRRRNLLLGVIAGLMHLSRADGILWLFIAFLVIIYFPDDKIKTSTKFKQLILGLFSILLGYLVIMGAWLIRNELVFGSMLAPGGNSMFWLTGYNQIFSYPSDSITFQAWLQKGLGKALEVRLWALNINLQNTLATQGSIFLLPLILIGIWEKRNDHIIRIAVFSWFSYLLLMSIVFPFAGARGGFFHAGAALQSIWWSLAPIGLVTAVNVIGKKRKWQVEKATKIFLIGLVGLSMMVTGIISFGKLYSSSSGWNNWNIEDSFYKEINLLIQYSTDFSRSTVMVSNPPGFFLASGMNSIAIPDGDITKTLEVAHKFEAGYLILEKNAYPDGLNPLYYNPENFPDFDMIGEVNGAHVFKILP